MKLVNFEEWFAIRSQHSDEDHWPGRLKFDVDKGITLSTARFLQSSSGRRGSTLHGQTLTGWLDYQQPATLIRPQIQATGGHTFSINTPALRESYNIIADALLKNIFLEDINSRVFTGVNVDHSAFHAWINPNLVNYDWKFREGVQFPSFAVDVREPKERTIALINGAEATVFSATNAPKDTNLTLSDYTILRLKLPEAVDYKTITRLCWRISTLFEFMIGGRTSSPAFLFPTNFTRKWNNEEKQIVAEFWYQPSRKKNYEELIPHQTERLNVESNSPIPLVRLLNILIGDNDELLYFIDIIQRSENQDLTLTQGFGELIGCLEDFDARNFGSGADPEFRDKARRLKAIVQKHGSEGDQILYDRMQNGARNSFSLLHRLQRLHQIWSADGFLGNPNLSRIRDLRNLIPHGKGLSLSTDIIGEMSIYYRYLIALSRYHVLRSLGASGEQVAAAFDRQAHRYGSFVPRKAISGESASEDQ